MSAGLYHTIQRMVRQELGRLRVAELAVVEAQHPHAAGGDLDNYACTVALRDSGQVLRRVPVATGKIGAASIPAVGDLVLVQFVGGDLGAPVITGSLYNDQDRPPQNDDGQAVLHLPAGAEAASAARLALSSAERPELALTLGDGLALTLRDDDPVIELSVDGGRMALTVDRDGTVTLESQGKLELKGSEITIAATGALALDGATIDIG